MLHRMTETHSGSSRADKPPTRPLIRCAWVGALSLAVAAAFWRWRGGEAAQQYLAGYLVELSLSVDNVFLFVLIFERFEVPIALQRRVLSWGIWGAIAMRGVLLLAGLGAIHRFRPVLYLFGAVLVYAGFRLIGSKDKLTGFDPANNRAVAFIRRHFPVSDRFSGDRFFAAEGGRRTATLLFVVLLAVEAADLIFAIDSLPAVMAVTRSAAAALASNFFAILGLRSLYFAVGQALPRFRRLKTGLALVLLFVGAKMIVEPWIVIPTFATLAVIALVLAISALAGRNSAR
jgi:tellurite resistance protein TerC